MCFSAHAYRVVEELHLDEGGMDMADASGYGLTSSVWVIPKSGDLAIQACIVSI